MDQIKNIPTPDNTCLLREYAEAFSALIKLNYEYHSSNDSAEREAKINDMYFIGFQLVQSAEMLSAENRFYTIEELKNDPKYDGHTPSCAEMGSHYVGDGGEKTGAGKFRKKWNKIKMEIDSPEHRDITNNHFMKESTFAERLAFYIRLGKLDQYWSAHKEDLHQ